MKSLRILMLGGSRYIGPHFVQAAVARGHQVSVFNRGRTPCDLPEGVEHLIGDRTGDLQSIMGREWDAVIDLAAFVPGWVRRVGEALKGRVEHYTFISTVMVYEDPASRSLTTEDSPVLLYKGDADPYQAASAGAHYGAFKILCEREAERHFPKKTLVIRCGHLVGPNDWYEPFPYLPVRANMGGEMMVAGARATPVQVIDVRDLASWAIGLIEKRVTGVFNGVGPIGGLTLGQLVEAAQTFGAAKTTWVAAEWLAAQPDNALWQKLLFWTDKPDGFFVDWMRMSPERAQAHGLVTRPLQETLADTLAWYRKLSAERQAQLIPLKSARADSTESIELTWAEFLKREAKLLDAWRSK